MSRTKKAARRGGRHVPSHRNPNPPPQRASKRQKVNATNSSSSVGVAHNSRDTTNASNSPANPFELLSGGEDAKSVMTSRQQQQLGTNRLKTGFGSRRKRRAIQRSASHQGTPEESDEYEPKSDLDVVDSEPDGGMTLNVQHGNATSTAILISSSSEDGEVHENDTPPSPNHDLAVPIQEFAPDDDEPTFVLDSEPLRTEIRLIDLNPDQLEDQLRYAFWDIDRDRIDLGRLARCLNCQAEGHIDDESCPRRTCLHCGQFGHHLSTLCPKTKRCSRCRLPGHDSASCDGMKSTTVPCDLCSLHGHTEDDCPSRFYPVRKLDPKDKVQLWISCCVCASKSHLVGDCPEADRAKASRWSLKALDPAQITNLSLTTGTQRQEKEAANRGIRPPGLSVKGRAARMQSQAAQYNNDRESDDDVDFFSRPPTARGRENTKVDQYRPNRSPDTRYDRYEANYTADSYRPPKNPFYETDSFGRPRHRSPSPRRRSPSPRIDSYRPDDRYRQPQKSRSARSPPTRTGPSGFVSVNIPARKSSNAPTATKSK